MTLSKIVSIPTLLSSWCCKEVPLYVRIARVENSFTQKVLHDASELFLEQVLNLTALEQVARNVTDAQYVHVIVVEHPDSSFGACARISFGASATDPYSDCFWVPVDARFLTI